MAGQPADSKVFPETYDYTAQHGDALTVEPGMAFSNGVPDWAGEERQNLAVILTDAKTGEGLTAITVNLGGFIGVRNGAHIDINNNPGIDGWLEANGIAQMTGGTGHSGYCTYPLAVFDEGFLKSIDDGSLGDYHRQFELPDRTDEAAWAICGKGERGPELWFFEAHLTKSLDSPTGEGFSFAAWNKDGDGQWAEYGGGLYYGFSEARELEEVIGDTVPFRELTCKPIPYLDFESVCTYGDTAIERRYTQDFGITAPEHIRKRRSFDVTICETLKRTVRVKANSADEARQIVEDGWKNEVHVLGAEDFAKVHFTVSERQRNKGLAR